MNPVDQYAIDVVANRLPAGKYHRLACARHLRDISRQEDHDFPFRFDLARAEKFFRFAQKMRHYKGEWAKQRIKLEPYQLFRLGSTFGWVHLETGLRRFRTSYHELPRKQGKSLEAAIVALFVTFFDQEPGAEGYCLHPKTRVLLADLSWRELEHINIGDQIIAVDEQVAGFRQHRKMRAATVTAKVRTRRPALRITFTNGAEVVCSPDHKWLSQSPGANGGKWREARALRQNYRIAYFGEPWSFGMSREAGYLAGLFDGEGHIIHGERVAFQVHFSQKPGAILDLCLDTLRRQGFHPSTPRPHAGGTSDFHIGGLYECLRLLGEIHPDRLWAKARLIWEGKKFPATTATIDRIERIGYEDLIDIETTARTFIAEGFVSHNCIATKRDQAKIVWMDSKKLVLSTGLRNRIKALAGNLSVEASSSKLEPLGADADSTDGLNPHLIIVDEFHKHKTRALIDVMESATGARRQPLNFQITTAGDDLVSPCGDQHDYACKILENIIEDDTFFGFIAHADLEDDWLDERTWQKANPNWNVSVKPDDMRALATKARNMPAAVAEFKQKRLNLWVNTLAPWLSMEGWRAGQHPFPADSLRKQRCYVGIDLASKLDLCAMVAVYPPGEGRVEWRLRRWVWTPEDTLRDRARRDRAPYDIWVAQGHLLTTPGTHVDQDAIRVALVALRQEATIELIGYDPWHGHHLVDDLVRYDGFSKDQLIEVPQTYAGMSTGAQLFEAEVIGARMNAGGCPLMTWAASNAVVQKDGKDNIYPVKKKSRGRIDPIMAAIIGVNLQLRHQPAPPKNYQIMILGGHATPPQAGGRA